ncbi:hypothetical protein HQQ94_02755 [Shewanella sp. VB17]|uniref:hypothetical protein n=1 Tax=Shewanella sp. VB17 TaxID=2739432 RepID=UPI001566958C|nr:hypothetical protein [Shewanella sp. VB17]NRD72174.1 hypothetical protein [Shewanella sp. VB17]
MILSKPFDKGELVDFDSSTCTFNKPVTDIDEKSKGNFHLLEQNIVAIFSLNSLLILQIGDKKWDLSSEDTLLRYSHDFIKKTTIFEVELNELNVSIEYEAWWAGIPNFEPIKPEIDEDEDFMGYIYAVWMNKGLQQHLISIWS